MQIAVVFIFFAIANVVYVSSVQQNVNSNYVYDVNKVNKVDRDGSSIVNNNIVEFGPWRAEYDVLGALERYPGTISICMCTVE